MTNERRIERLTREALGPRPRTHYSKRDDNLLRIAGIVVLIVTVVAFASWPRDDASANTRQATKSSAAQADLGNV